MLLDIRQMSVIGRGFSEYFLASLTQSDVHQTGDQEVQLPPCPESFFCGD